MADEITPTEYGIHTSSHEGDASPEHAPPEVTPQSTVGVLDKRRVKVVTWNCNGFANRCSDPSSLVGFANFLKVESPDVVSLTEVQMTARGGTSAQQNDKSPRDQSRIHLGAEQKTRFDHELMQQVFFEGTSPLSEYQPYWSLANRKYSGCGVLVRRGLVPLSVRFSLTDTPHNAFSQPTPTDNHHKKKTDHHDNYTQRR